MNVSALSYVNDYSNAYPRLYTREDVLAQKVESLALERKEQRDHALSQTDWKGRFMVASDALNVGYIGLQGAQLASNSLSRISGVFWTTLTCGAIAGIVNIIMGMISLHEASKNSSDTLQKIRLFLDGLCQISIGAIMFLVSLSIKVSALAALGTTFAAPWLLPLLFLIIALPTLVEVVKREVEMSKSKNDVVTQLLESNTNFAVPKNLQNLKTRDEIKKTMESIETKWGIDSAIEAMQLWTHLLRKDHESAKKSIERLELQTTKWKRAQHVRLFEQALLIGSFGLNMLALSPRMNPDKMDAANSFAMVGASVVPIYPDAAWPTLRGTPLVI